MQRLGTRGRSGLMFGVGVMVMLVVILILQSVLGLGIPPSKTSTSTAISTTTTTAISTTTATTTTATTVTTTTTGVTNTPAVYEQIAEAFAYHMFALNSGNLSALEAGYTSSASITWTGVYHDNEGNSACVPSGDCYMFMTGLVTNLIQQFGFFNASSASSHHGLYAAVNETAMISPEGGGLWLVDSSFAYSGYTIDQGIINGTIVAQDYYTQVNGTWVIFSETWNYLSFQTQIFTQAAPLN